MTYQDPHPHGVKGESGSGGRAAGVAAVAGAGALVGIVTALVALGVAQLVAAILGSPTGEPIPAVGEMSINHTSDSLPTVVSREVPDHEQERTIEALSTASP